MPLFSQSPQDALTQGVNNLKTVAEQQATDILTTFQSFIDFVWKNPTFSPQQVLDGFGPDATKLFQLSSAVVAIYQIMYGTTPTVIPQGYVPTFNPDGTVTLHYDGPDSQNRLAP